MKRLAHPQVQIRPVTAADAVAMASFLVDLDGASRRLRFHGGVNPGSQTLLRHLTQADGQRHVAWVAVVAGPDGAERVVGEARYVRDTANPDEAELAMSVAVAWRGRRVADRLLRELQAHARRAGVRRLVAEVLDDNARMLAFLRRHGFDVAFDLGLDDSAGVRLALGLGAPAGVGAWGTWVQGLASVAAALHAGAAGVLRPLREVQAARIARTARTA